MKIRSLIRHFKQAFSNFWRNGWMSFASISAMTVSLFVLGIVVAGISNLNKVATDIENDVNVKVYLDLTASREDVLSLGEEILGIDGVTDVTFFSKDDELENVVGIYGDSFIMFEGDENPLRDTFDVQTSSAEMTPTVSEKIKELSHVYEVNDGGQDAQLLYRVVDIVQIVGIVAVIILFVLTLFLISNTIRITISNRQSEIEIMKLVGATNSYIRWPYLIEGSLIGFIGGLLPALATAGVYYLIYQRSFGFFRGTVASLYAPYPFILYLGGALVLIGIIVGALGSMNAIRRYLDV